MEIQYSNLFPSEKEIRDYFDVMLFPILDEINLTSKFELKAIPYHFHVLWFLISNDYFDDVVFEGYTFPKFGNKSYPYQTYRFKLSESGKKFSRDMFNIVFDFED